MKTTEQFQSPGRLSAATGLVAAAMIAFLSACSGANTSQNVDSTSASSTTVAAGSPAGAPIPAAINAVGTYGEDLYDQAKAGNWGTVEAYRDSLHTAAANLPSGDQVQSQRTQLDSSITELDKAVAARNREAAQQAANRVTYLAAQMGAPYHAATPTEVVLLDYYGRELEIWAAQRNLPKLKETAAALESTWNAVRPAVEGNGGAVAARQTDALVSQIKAAATPASYARIATQFLNQVDSLEQVFVKA
jgi:hypothetical protein